MLMMVIVMYWITHGHYSDDGLTHLIIDAVDDDGDDDSDVLDNTGHHCSWRVLGAMLMLWSCCSTAPQTYTQHA